MQPQQHAMDDRQRIEVMQMVGHFRGKEFTNEDIQAFCEAEGIEQPVTAGFLKDYIFQADMDVIMAKIMPEIFDLMKKYIDWVPLFALQVSHQEGNAKLKELMAEIVKLTEREGVPYFFVESMIQSFDQPIKAIFDGAARIAKRRCTDVFEHLASKHFNHEEMTMADVQAYTNEHLEAKPEAEATDEAAE